MSADWSVASRLTRALTLARSTRMAVAAAQLAIADAGFAEKPMDPETSGVVLGSDYMLTMPEDYSLGMKTCAPAGEFEYSKWGKDGLNDMAPLWMLKYLPNMPACHVSILHDAQGPNNTITESDVASLLALGEAYRILQRGGADFFLAPADNCSDVVGHVPDGLRVVRVATFDEGRAALTAIGKGDLDGLPSCG